MEPAGYPNLNGQNWGPFIPAQIQDFWPIFANFTRFLLGFRISTMIEFSNYAIWKKMLVLF